MADEAWLQPPAALRAAYADSHWRIAYQYPGHSAVYRLERGGAPRLFVKLAPTGTFPSLATEAERMRWARAWLPVPETVDEGSDGSVDWLVTTPLPGRDATDAELMRDPAELTRILARGLRRFHDDAPVEACPFDFRLPAAMRHARSRVRSGMVDTQRDFHEEFAHLTPDAALRRLEATRPRTEDLVVCHGDYCLPNILVEDGRATGFVDLGELGTADRWWDLAVASWSLTWNLGPGLEELFVAEYGASWDAERVAFYRLLYDLAS